VLLGRSGSAGFRFQTFSGLWVEQNPIFRVLLPYYLSLPRESLLDQGAGIDFGVVGTLTLFEDGARTNGRVDTVLLFIWFANP